MPDRGTAEQCRHHQGPQSTHPGRRRAGPECSRARIGTPAEALVVSWSAPRLWRRAWLPLTIAGYPPNRSGDNSSRPVRGSQLPGGKLPHAAVDGRPAGPPRDSGRLSIQNEPVHVADQLEQVADMARSTLERPLELKLPSNPAERDSIAQADPGRLRQVLLDLIENADKYSPADRPILLQMHLDEQHHCIDVIDQGIGIPEAELEEVFERFHRASNAPERTGSGLGLSGEAAGGEKAARSCAQPSGEGSCSRLSAAMISYLILCSLLIPVNLWAAITAPAATYRADPAWGLHVAVAATAVHPWRSPPASGRSSHRAEPVRHGDGGGEQLDHRHGHGREFGWLDHVLLAVGLSVVTFFLLEPQTRLLEQPITQHPKNALIGARQALVDRAAAAATAGPAPAATPQPDPAPPGSASTSRLGCPWRSKDGPQRINT